MAYTLSDIRTKVRQRVPDTAYDSSEITNYLNDTQNDIFNEYRLGFMEATQTYTVTSGAADITNGSGLPSNFVQGIDLINTTSGQESVIPYIASDQLDQMYPDRDDTARHPNGQPQYWYYYAETIKLFPAPGGAYTLTLRYYKKPTLLTADADIPDVPSEFEELLVVGATFRVLQVKGNYDEAGIYENKYLELLQKLVNRYSRPHGGVVVMPVNRVTSRSRFIDSWHRVP